MDERQQANHPPSPTVRVRGDGALDVVPDAATISLGVLVSKPSQQKARAEAAAQATAIVGAIKEAGIPEGDIQTNRFTVTPRHNAGAKGKPIGIVGYEVRNTVNVTVRDLDIVAAVLDAAMAAGANEVHGPDFFIQHPEVAEDEARRLAMTSARRRAEVLAAVEGKALGPVRSIVDADARGPAPRMAMMSRMASADVATPIEAGTERISASVEVVWELV